MYALLKGSISFLSLNDMHQRTLLIAKVLKLFFQKIHISKLYGILYTAKQISLTTKIKLLMVLAIKIKVSTS